MNTTKATHTPGPWTADFCRNGMEGDDHWRVVDGVYVVAVPQLERNAEADARLIAAAPDLLEACKNCVDSFEAAWRDQGWNTEPNSGQVPLTELAAVNRARSAIARAEGGAS